MRLGGRLFNAVNSTPIAVLAQPARTEGELVSESETCKKNDTSIDTFCRRQRV